MERLSELTSNVLDHPFRVTTAVLSVETKGTILRTTTLVFFTLVLISGGFGYFLFRVIAKEINERKNVEVQLRASIKREKELADIVRVAPIAIAFGYPDGKLENCNAAFSKLVGYSIFELQNINWSKSPGGLSPRLIH